MSVIWGIINLDWKEADESLGYQMEQAMMQYKLDRCHTCRNENAVMGCGIQYITPEAVHERLPFYDEATQIFYTSDCMLDNREELLQKLSVRDCVIPDGYLIYLAYLEWGDQYVDHVLGSFSMVAYHKQTGSCYLFADHTGSRSLYYSIVNNVLYFATTFAPMLAVMPQEDRSFNEKWITICELSATPIMEYYPGETPFDKIHYVMPGHFVKLQRKGADAIIDNHCYWNLNKIKKIKLKSQEEYRELFTKTLFDCVKSVLRSKENTAITLSSGLDSASVACIAAAFLEHENKKLYSFTSIPVTKYVEEKNPYYITDESEGVKAICNAYGNIDPEFVTCEGKNAFSELKRMVPFLEFPHKSRHNMVWLDELYERASLKGCKVVLKGQYGNATISQGKIFNRVYDEIKHLRFASGYHEINMFCKNLNISRKKTIKMLVREWMKERWRCKNSFENTLVLKDLLEKHNIIHYINQLFKAGGSDLLDLRSQEQRNMNYMMSFSQIGAIDTRFGLQYGIVIRDPLKDKRIVELCNSLPLKCYVQNGVERAAVRMYMRDIVPDTILDTVKRRGLQSADYITRLRLDWERISKEMLDILNEPRLLHFIDKGELLRLREEVKGGDLFVEEGKIINVLMLSSFSFFLKHFGG